MLWVLPILVPVSATNFVLPAPVATAELLTVSVLATLTVMPVVDVIGFAVTLGSVIPTIVEEVIYEEGSGLLAVVLVLAKGTIGSRELSVVRDLGESAIKELVVETTNALAVVEVMLVLQK